MPRTRSIISIRQSTIISLLDSGISIDRVAADFDMSEADVIDIARRAKITKAFNLKDVPGLDGYHASADGRIFSTRGRHLRELGQRPCKAYLVVKADGQNHYVYKLIARTFLPAQPPGTEVCHNDGNPRNNAASNLRYDTHKANMAESIRQGRHYRKGPHRAASKLTPDQVVEIKQLLAGGQISQRQIAIRYSVDPANITAIHKGKTWRHVSVPTLARAA